MANGGIFASKLKIYKEQAKQLKGKTLEVGFFGGARYADSGVNGPNGRNTPLVAEVAYWNEFGVPENNQPPRPFFRQAISENKGEWIDYVRQGLENGYSMDAVMNGLGSFIVSNIKDSITNFTDPPLASSTIKAKQKKGSQFASHPLIDTETMRNNVNYQVNTND